MSNAYRILLRASALGTPVAATRLLQDPAHWEAFTAQLSLADDGRLRGIHFCPSAPTSSEASFSYNIRYPRFNDDFMRFVQESIQNTPATNVTGIYNPELESP